MRQRLRKYVATFVGLPILFVGMLGSYLFVFQESIIFAGSTLAPNYRFEFNVPFEELRIPLMARN